MSYFDVNNTDHTDLINVVSEYQIDVYDGSGNPLITQAEADEAERRVVQKYTVRYDGINFIFLSTYSDDGLDEQENEDFLLRFRKAVAAVIAWRQIKRQFNPLVTRHTLGKETIEYDTDVVKSDFPPDFNSFLEPYDNRPIL